MPAEPLPPPPAADPHDAPPPATRVLRPAAEAGLFPVIFGGVWAVRGVEAEWEFALGLGVGLLTLIWVARCVLYRRLSLRPDPVSAGLAGIVLLSAIQLVPLPVAVVSVLSPGAADVHRTFRPVT